MSKALIITSFIENEIDINSRVNSEDYVICTDGGYDIATVQGIRPDLILGDFDSITGALPEDIEIKRSWRLNERHYGALQGLNKDETKAKYGENQVLLWRRSTDVRPPELEENDPRYPGNDPKYKDLTKEELPKTENLLDTIKRVLEYWNSDIKPEIEKGKEVIIVAHGNSLRGLIKYLDNISDEDIINLELQTGNPICYELDENLKPIRHYYLKDK